MTKEIRVNAFNMNGVGHICHGLWTHPRDTSSQYTDIAYRVKLAQTLERGKFDGLLLADILGVYDVHQGNYDVTAREAVQLPVNNPLMLVSAMAAVTEHLGFGVTASLSYEPPYPLARTMSQVIGELAAATHVIDGLIMQNAIALDRSALSIAAGSPEADDLVIESTLATAKTQLVVAQLSLQAAERMYEAGGASATSRAPNFDRHWRNLRTIFSHNPLLHKARVIGDFISTARPRTCVKAGSSEARQPPGDAPDLSGLLLAS